MNRRLTLGVAAVCVVVFLGIVALLMPTEPSSPKQPPRRIRAVAAPPTKPPVEVSAKMAPAMPTTTTPFSELVVVDGAKYHLQLPEDLPRIVFHGDLWFSELDPKDGNAPELFVVETKGPTHTFATIPIRAIHLPGASELRFFSWEPFGHRYRPGLRSLLLASSKMKMLPLVQPRMEVEAEGSPLYVPPNEQIVITATVSDGGVPHGPLLAAAFYDGAAPAAEDPNWPFELTRLVLTNGEPSPTLTGVRELAFIATDVSDQYVVTVAEGSNSRDQLWPTARLRADPLPISVQILGHYEGYWDPYAVLCIGRCSEWPEVSRECLDECTAEHPYSSFCKRLNSEKGGRTAAPTSGEAEKARPEPKSPAKQ